MSMQRARRLASVAVVASLGLAGLSACRQAPSVAAYLGSLGRISESRVQEVWDDAHTAVDRMNAEAAAKQSDQLAVLPSRADIVTTLIAVKVLDQVAKARGLTAQPDKVLQQDAASLRIPPDTEYMKQYARWDSLVSQLKTGAADAPGPTDNDLKQVYDVLHAQQGIDPSLSFDQFKQQLPDQNRTLVRMAAAARDQIQQVVAPLKIKVNPRYQPATLSVLNFQTEQSAPPQPLIAVPLGRNDAVAPVSPAS
jgi:hypothetical protein